MHGFHANPLFIFCHVVALLVSSTAFGQWNTTSPHIYYSTGYVGIGLSTPGHPLDVNGTGQFRNKLYVNANVSDDNSVEFNNASQTGYGLYSRGGLNSRYSFSFRDQADEQVMIGYYNRVGIGPDLPSHKLDVFDNGTTIIRAKSLGVASGEVGFRLERGGSNPIWWFAYIPSNSKDLKFHSSDGGEHLTIKTNGNVGVGVSSPSYPLDVRGQINNITNLGTQGEVESQRWATTNADYNFRLQSRWDGNGIYQRFVQKWDGADKDLMSFAYGNTGFGIPAGNIPNARVQVHAAGTTTNLILSKNYVDKYRWAMNVVDRGEGLDLDFSISDYNDAYETVMKLARTNTGRPEFAIHDTWLVANNGNIGIGMNNPLHRLDVNGTIHSKEVKVDLDFPAPDYVFEPAYNLPSLDSVASYIKTHKHLPEIPSAKEMEANGINLSEMNMLLLKKVEELTLYIIREKDLNAQRDLLIEKLQNELTQIQRKLQTTNKTNLIR